MMSRDNVWRIIEVREKLNDELDAKKKERDSLRKELNKREATTEYERQKLDRDKKKNDERNKLLQLASVEQKKADESVLRWVEELKREKEDALYEILQVEKEIKELNGKLEVMKHLRDEDEEPVKKKIEDMNQELREKAKELEDLEMLNQTLITKERQNNDELQEARKVLIAGLPEMLAGQSHIGRFGSKALPRHMQVKISSRGSTGSGLHFMLPVAGKSERSKLDSFQGDTERWEL